MRQDELNWATTSSLIRKFVTANRHSRGRASWSGRCWMTWPRAGHGISSATRAGAGAFHWPPSPRRFGSRRQPGLNVPPDEALVNSEKFRIARCLNLLDENFPEDQLPLLKEWHIPFRRVGHDIARLGIKDDHIIPVLHQLHGVTFFTQDWDFFDSSLCHSAYCLVWLDARADDAARYVRLFLRHSRFNSQAKRMGIVARAHHGWESTIGSGNRAGTKSVPWIHMKREIKVKGVARYTSLEATPKPCLFSQVCLPVRVRLSNFLYAKPKRPDQPQDQPETRGSSCN